MGKLRILLLASLVFLSGCFESEVGKNKLVFATEAMYPPFEYQKYGELKGFDIDLARLVAKELGKEAVFKDVQFSSILPMVQNGQADAGIATLTITAERQQNVGMSKPYYFDILAVVYKNNKPLKTIAELSDKKIACQLGSTMEIWVKKHIASASIILMDTNNQEIEALKAGHIDAVVLDGSQAYEFTKNNPSLSFATLAKVEDGFGIMVKKDSPLLNEINKALDTLEKNGELLKLKQQWFGKE